MKSKLVRERKLLYLTGLGTFVLALLLLVIQQWFAARDGLLKEGRMLAALLGANASAALVFKDPNDAQEVLRSSAHSPLIRQAELRQADGRLLARHRAPDAQTLDADFRIIPAEGFLFTAHHLLIRETVRVNERAVGDLILVLDQGELQGNLFRFLIALLVIVASAFAFFWFSSSQLRRKALEIEAALHHQAHHDRLTGLANRFSFEVHLEQLLTTHLHHPGTSALLFLDVDGFKKVNDHFGHHMGDQVLQEIAARLKTCLRPGDLIARLGGDEFAVILRDIDHPDTIERVAQKMIGVLANPFFIQREAAHLGLSIGVAIIPDDGRSAEDILTHADMAMYQAKKDGRNQVNFFSSSIAQVVHERIALEQDLRTALADHQLFLAYQPQIDPGTGRMRGIEALVRWRHPEKGLIPPGIFIPIAEESDLILDVGQWVLTQACRDINRWREHELEVPPVSINLSARQFACSELREKLLLCLHRFSLTPRDVELELTESLAMTHAERATQNLKEISEAGFRIAIDDFGTGYSSLAYLKKLPVSKLKIDRSFVIGLGQVPEDEAIVTAIIHMAQALGLMVVAEGVETDEQARFLQTVGCDLFQGYLTGRPMPAEELLERLRGNKG